MVETLNNKLFRIRYTSHRGSIIFPHHSIYKAQFTTGILLSMILIPIFVNIVFLLLLNPILLFWENMMDFWISKTGIPLYVALSPSDVSRMTERILPYPEANIRMPQLYDYLYGLLATLIAGFGVKLLPQQFTPLRYFVWLFCLVMLFSIVFFNLDTTFYFTLNAHIVGHMILSISFMMIIPWVLGFAYNIFHFHLLRKILLPIVIVGYFVLLYPLQYVMHVYLIHKCSVLIVPTLYFLFIVFLDVMMFIAFYSWAISWENRDRSDELNLRTSFQEMEEILRESNESI